MDQTTSSLYSPLVTLPHPCVCITHQPNPYSLVRSPAPSANSQFLQCASALVVCENQFSGLATVVLYPRQNWVETMVLVMCAGDHLAYSGLLGHMTFHKQYGLDLDLQIESTKKLLDYDFRHLLPGHGRRIHFIDSEHRRTMIEEGISHRI